PAASPQAVAEAAPIVITSLPSVAALNTVVLGPQGLMAAQVPGRILVETSTLPIEDKQSVHDQATGWHMLDCPLSGTGAQAAKKDLLVYASGNSQAIAACSHVFNGFAKAHHDVGAFGNGSRMKFVANLLVAIHNVATAEAFALGMKAGLDAETIYKVIADGAGGSRMFTVRGPLMVANHYEPATMKVETWQKDMKIIAEFAAEVGAPTPLFHASAPIYSTAMAQGLGSQDTAAVFAVLADMARLKLSNPQ
ncbi:MAG: NAD(P)-dependent oxidoreductase, partial [Betaproteobacteria bacterium]|nr:NAD(P)-dependent oxidoreductase [Betaproteobacteria bacterium]